MLFKNRKGQSTLEFAILIVIIIGALIAMQNFIKRGYQGRLRSASDEMGEQYSPGYVKSGYHSVSYTASEEGAEDGRSISRIHDQQQIRKGYEKVAKGEFEYWGKADEIPDAGPTNIPKLLGGVAESWDFVKIAGVEDPKLEIKEEDIENKITKNKVTINFSNFQPPAEQ